MPRLHELWKEAAAGAGMPLPSGGTAFISVQDGDKQAAVPIAAGLAECGFRLLATSGTNAGPHMPPTRSTLHATFDEGYLRAYLNRVAGSSDGLLVGDNDRRSSYEQAL